MNADGALIGRFFQIGWDTAEIAKFLDRPEAEIYNELHKYRERKRNEDHDHSCAGSGNNNRLGDL